MSVKKKPKRTLAEARTEASGRNRSINEQMIGRIAKESKLTAEKIDELLKTLRLRIDTARTKRLLEHLFVSDGKAAFSAVNTFLYDKGKYEGDPQQKLVKTFLRYLVYEQEVYERDGFDLSEETRVMPGTYDRVDDEVTKDELDFCVDDFED